MSEGASGTAPTPTRHAGRSILAAIVGVLAVIGLTGAIIGFWALKTASDTDRVETRVTELLQREDVSNALAQRVVAELVEVVPVGDAVASVVPTVLEPAVNLLLAGIRSQVETRLAETIRTPAVSETVGAAAGTAYATAVKVVEGDDVVDGVDVSNGEVRVNLLPLAARAILVLQDIGLFRDVVVPEMDRAGDPVVQRAELSAALGVDLPTDFGEPVVFRSEAVDNLGKNVQLVRDLLLFAKRALWALVAVGLLLGAAAIWLSARRWRAASYLVAGVLAITLIVRLVLRRVSNRAPDAVDTPAAKETVSEIVGNLEASLNHTMLWYCVISILALVVAAVVASRTPRQA